MMHSLHDCFKWWLKTKHLPMPQSLKAHVCMCVCLYQVMQVERLLIKHDVFLCSLLDQALLTKWSGVKLSSNIKYLEAFALQLQLHTSFIQGMFVK